MYHYIKNFDKNIPFFNFLHLNDFKKQINYFKKTWLYQDKNLEQIFHKNKFLITFDDGLER